MSALAANARALEREFAWVARVIEERFKHYFDHPGEPGDVRHLAPPELDEDDSPYAALVRRHALSYEARFTLALALAPHLRPQLLDPLLTKNRNLDRHFTEFGGRHGGHCFLPTLHTAAFLLTGEDLQARLALLGCFAPDGVLRRARLLELEREGGAQEAADPVLALHPECLGWLTTGTAYEPAYSSSFPAQRLHTSRNWDELVLAAAARADVDEIRAWIAHRDVLLNDWELADRIKPGYRALFYGPPGTGKTLTASLLGKTCSLPVYRIDLSLVVSKYIGETEKNLARVFDRAERQDWILFFDEADALFGKRTQTSNANDRHANQEVAYLLQRVEDFPGVVILATNLKSNIDEAFARRFQSMVYFPMPSAPERLLLWRQAFAGCVLAPEVDFERIAQEYEISGGAIANVLRYACLMALRHAGGVVRLADLRHGIARELRKEGKVL
jgi:hypothetical protein